MKNAVDYWFQLALGTCPRIHNAGAAGEMSVGEAVPSTGIGNTDHFSRLPWLVGRLFLGSYRTYFLSTVDP